MRTRRLSLKLWSVRAAGVTNANKKAVKNATRSIEKVMGKVKSKITIDSSVVSMSSEAAISQAAGDAGGAFVDLTL